MTSGSFELRSRFFLLLLLAVLAGAAFACYSLLREPRLVTGPESRTQHVQQQELVSDSVAQGELAAFELSKRLPDLVVSGLDPRANFSGTDRTNLQLLTAALLDSSGPLNLRRQAAWNLAKLRSQQAFLVLHHALANAPATLKATIAEALGKFDSAESKDLLRALVRGDNGEVARGALRGWASLGDSESIQLLAKTLLDGKKGDDLRAEAALGLSKVNHPRAYQTLLDGIDKISDREVVKSILTGLGERPFAETEGFFRAYVERSDLSTDLRVAAVEALGQSDGNATPLLLQQLRSEDSRIRAAAAWALATLDNPVDAAPQFFSFLEREGDPEVRKRIYQALENQSNLDSEQLLNAVLNESEPEPRLAGLKTFAAQVAENQFLATEFDRFAVPLLEKLAIGRHDLNDRLVAVIALKQAQTRGALEALAKIGAPSTGNKIIAAAKMQK